MGIYTLIYKDIFKISIKKLQFFQDSELKALCLLMMSFCTEAALKLGVL